MTRTNGALWFWHSAWAASLLVGLGIVMLYAWLPVDGATGDLESFTPQGFRVQWLLEEREGGLRAGDLIVRAGGYTVEEWLRGAPQKAREAWRSGEIISYQIVRSGQPMTLQVRLAPISLRAILAHWAPQLLVALTFLLIGTYVFWRRPHELAARVLMLFCMATTLQYLGDAYNLQYGTLPRRWPLWFHLAYEYGTYGLSIASICYFALIFPIPHPVTRRFPRLVPLGLYTSHVLAIGGAMSLSARTTIALQVGSTTSWLIAMSQIGLAIGAGIRSFRTAPDPVTRAQIRWIVWTAAVGTLILVPGYVLPLMLRGRPVFSHPATMVMIAAMPIVLAIVILRYHLFDIEVIINRSLVYGTLTVLLGILYLILVRLLTLLIQDVLNRPNDNLVVFIATLGIALAFEPLRQRVQTWIAYAFYRAKVNYQDLLAEMSDRLVTCIFLDQLASLLAQELPRRLQIDWATLSVLDPAGKKIVPVHRVSFPPVPVDHPLVDYVRRTGVPLLRLQPPLDLPAEATSFLERHRVELIIPLAAGSQVVGMYALGLKLSGNAYNRYDIRLLRILGQQAAISVQNARLFQQVENYSRTLEDQVRQRTNELEVAYRDLDRQHATLNVVLSSMADGLVVTDLDGRIILTNSAFAETVAGTRDHLNGRQLSQVLPDPSLSSAVAQALEVPSAIVTVDTRWSDRVYRASACALRGTDHPISGVVTVLRDITQEVEVARIKDEFVSMVSHELRTPLTSIIGFTHLIYRQLVRTLQPRIALDDYETQKVMKRVLGDLQIIIDQGARLTRLINNVLDLSRMKTGSMRWDMGRVQLASVIQNSIAATLSAAQDKGISIKTEIALDLPDVYGDRDRLIQAVTNLLSNAIKFTHEGEIQIRAWQLQPGDDVVPLGTRQPEKELDLPATEPLLGVSITDTGVGISEDELSIVFEQFRQAGDQNSDTRQAGTGLGLPISREIIEHHGGQIWVESRPGEGSRFIFLLHPM